METENEHLYTIDIIRFLILSGISPTYSSFQFLLHTIENIINSPKEDITLAEYVYETAKYYDRSLDNVITSIDLTSQRLWSENKYLNQQKLHCFDKYSTAPNISDFMLNLISFISIMMFDDNWKKRNELFKMLYE